MLRVHILYEHGQDLRPHSSAFIRLLRPFFHPALAGELRVTAGRWLPQDNPDVVIVDRLWRSYDIDSTSAHSLVDVLRSKSARMIYAFDDNFEDWVLERPWVPAKFRDVFRCFLEASNGILVTTPLLAERFSREQPNVAVVPNMLDERLLIRRWPIPDQKRRIVVGYMGTPTHHGDLGIILPAFRKIASQLPGRVQFQFIGVLDQAGAAKCPLLEGLPFRILQPHPHQVEYPLFMLWYGSQVHWDIAVAPLETTAFNQYKSDLKLLDYAAIGAAGIYSDFTPYRASVIHGETGLLVPNESEAWVDALYTLIEDADLRYEIQSRAVKYLFEERVLYKAISKFTEAVYKLAR